MKMCKIIIVSLFLMGSGALSFAEGAKPDNAALKVIHSRKSVRHYIDGKVSKEDLLTIIKAGMAAPTAVDRRPWAFIVVTDESKLERLESGLPHAKMITKAGSCIVVCGVLEKALSGEGQEYWIQDCSAATENILLAAESMGLGAVWTGVYPSKERMDQVRRVLGIPENVMPLNVIPIGYPVGDEKPKDKFEPADIHWETW